MTTGAGGRQGHPPAARRSWWPWALALLVLALDQFSKAWALQQLQPGQVSPLLPGLLQLRRVGNSGAAFSLLSGNSLGLGLVSAAVALAVAGWMVLRPPQGRWLKLAAALVLAGALGNGLDRWRSGSVVDFLELVPIQFPIFNIADVAINVAVACFLLDSWPGRQPRHPHPD